MAAQNSTTRDAHTHPTNRGVFHQLDLFQDRMPYKPYCTDDFINGLKIRQKKTALTFPYIQANPPRLRSFLIFDVDRIGGAFAFDDANLPAPAWAAVSDRGHAHLAWALDAPVLTGDGSRDAPLRYLVAIENAYHYALKADPGYSGLITKNPWHGKWRTWWADPKFHTLEMLAEHVDLKKHLPKKKPEEIGCGRNCITFDRLRHWGYPSIRRYRTNRCLAGWNGWLAETYAKGLEFNGELTRPLDAKEVWHIAKSVSKYCWRNDPAIYQRFLQRQQEFIEKQRQRGINSGIARLEKSDKFILTVRNER